MVLSLAPPATRVLGLTASYASALLALGIATIPLQWFPPLPVPSMQLSDLLFAAAFALFAASAVREPRRSFASLRRSGTESRWFTSGAALFAVGAAASALANGGQWLKLIGHVELVFVAIMVVSLCAGAEGNEERNLHRDLFLRALIAAAALAAITGLIGAVLFYAGIDTPLLNPTHGDLVSAHYPRVRGTTVRANQLASVIATGFVVLFCLPQLVPAHKVRRAMYLLFSAALLFTLSRTVPFLILILCAAEFARRKAPLWQWCVLAALGLGGLAILWLSIRYHIILNPLRPWQAQITAQPGTRWIHLSDALHTAAAHPWFGIGPGRTPGGDWSAHFTWINVCATLGLGALVGFALLFASTLHRACYSAAWWAALLFFSDSLHRDIEDMRHLWVVLGLAAIAQHEHARIEKTAPNETST